MIILGDDIRFPELRWVSPEGIIAIGGDLGVERLLSAYSRGIFPWYNEGSEILWWMPDPRFVLFTNELKVSKSMGQVIRSGKFRVTYDTRFEEVINHCKMVKRKGQFGTWITDEMKDAYIEFHRAGYAHSVEVWLGAQLVGGLYGVSLGRIFFGESMFSYESNASKYGFIMLVNALKLKGFKLIDCQDYTAHLFSMGARNVSRKEFELLLQSELQFPTMRGNWVLTDSMQRLITPR